MRQASLVLCALIALLLCPVAARAQATIAGLVKDASGAVLPGVTVEAASPVLIEKTRSTITDATGQYRIINLLPGTYTVTFTLTGFSTIKREDIELSGTFTATVNADLKVGGVSETITVSGETPIVDTQSIRRQTTISNELMTAIPTARSWAATALLIPGIVTIGGGPTDIQVTPQMTVFGGAGGRNNEGRMQVDGLNAGAGLGGSGVSTYVADISNAQEVVTTTSGGLGEAEVGGPSLSIIPRSGGNTIKGAAYLSGVSKGMVGSNYSDALKAAGLTTPGVLLKQWDFTFGIGGPIKKDRLWYYVTARDEGQYRSIPNIFPNLNAGDPTKRLYVADKSREVQGAESWRLYVVRLTYQASQRNKFNLHWDEQHPCNGSTFGTTGDGCRNQPESGAVYGPLGLGGLSSTTSPETGGYLYDHPRVRLLTWSSPLTNRLLFEAGFGAYQAPFGPYESPGNTTRGLARVTEQCAAGCGLNGGIPNLTYRSANWGHSWDAQYTWRGSMSYVTGSHNLKIGYGGVALVSDLENHTNDLNLAYTLSNGTPISLTQSLLPFTTSYRTRNMSFYVQDQWTHGRLTLQGALRFDRNWSFSPEQQIPASAFLATPITFPQTPGVTGYKDLSPRGGFAYDLFGNGKTSVKVNFGKYLEPTSNNNNYILSNPIGRIATTSPRSWTDSNNNFVPDCDLRNQAPQNLTASGGDICGQGAPTFGTTALTTAAIDPKILEGWGVRSNDWQIGVSIQQQVLPRVSVEAGYFRRWLNNFTVTDNLLVGPGDFTPYSMTAPSDPRLPGGGNYVVSGLYNVVPGKFNQTSNNITLASDFGDQYQRYNGMLLNVSARLGAGLTFQGGVNTGKTVQDNCAVRAALPELTIVAAGVSPAVGVGNPYCHSDPGFITKITALGSYTLPKIDVLVSGTFRSDQGAALAANWNAPAGNATLAPGTVSAALGRAAAVVGTTVPINLVAPGQVWGDRVNALDMRFAKIIRFGRTRNTIGIDLYNITNSAAILTYNQTFNPAATTGSQAWLAPLSVLTPRFMKIGVQIDF